MSRCRWAFQHAWKATLDPDLVRCSNCERVARLQQDGSSEPRERKQAEERKKPHARQETIDSLS